MAQIFVVEDDADHRAYVKACLTRLGHEATVFNGGADCLAHLDQQVPEIIITDVFMPGKDGVELLTELRAKNLDIPVIGMTGGFKGVVKPYENIFMVLGANSVLRKPFGFDELKSAIAEVHSQAA